MGHGDDVGGKPGFHSWQAWPAQRLSKGGAIDGIDLPSLGIIAFQWTGGLWV
jgi:hypothetical protein